MIDVQDISNSLTLNEDGVWCSCNAATSTSYPDSGHETCFQVEDQSFWFSHRNNCINEAIRQFPPDGPIFDVGGGNGYVCSTMIREGFEAALVEPGYGGALRAKERGVETVICSTLQDAGFAKGSIPSAALFDVLEHIEDDVLLLKEIRELLAADGRLYLTVPAYQFLWSVDDEDAQHYRRYNLKQITSKLISCGYNIDYQTYFFRLLPIPIFLLRSLPSRLGMRSNSTQQRTSKEHVISSTMVRNTIDKFLSIERNNVLHRKTMRFGGSCLIVASKRQQS